MAGLIRADPETPPASTSRAVAKAASLAAVASSGLACSWLLRRLRDWLTGLGSVGELAVGLVLVEDDLDLGGGGVEGVAGWLLPGYRRGELRAEGVEHVHRPGDGWHPLG